MSLLPYEDAFQTAHQKIALFSPRAVALLEQLRDRNGEQLAFYAAFVILYLEARVQYIGYQTLEQVSLQDLNGFTFFEVTQHNANAQAMFGEALDCYLCEGSLRTSGMG